MTTPCPEEDLDVLSFQETFGGMGTAAMALCSHWFDGDVKQLDNRALCQNEVSCAMFVRTMSEGVTTIGDKPCLKFHAMQPAPRTKEFAPECVLSVFSAPSQPFGSDVVETPSDKDAKDAETVRSYAARIQCMHKDGVMNVAWFENVASFRKSEAWQLARAGMANHDVYELMVDLHKDVGLPTSMTRWYALSKRGGFNSAQLDVVVREEMRIESGHPLALHECILWHGQTPTCEELTLLKKMGVNKSEELPHFEKCESSNVNVVLRMVLKNAQDAKDRNDATTVGNMLKEAQALLAMIAERTHGEKEELAHMGVTVKCVRGLMQLTASQRIALEIATAEMPNRGLDDWYVIDLGLPAPRLEKACRRGPGVCPSITPMNCWNRLWCTRLRRFFLPQELMLIKGFEMEALYATRIYFDGIHALQQVGHMVANSPSPAVWRIWSRASTRMWPELFATPHEKNTNMVPQEAPPPASTYSPSGALLGGVWTSWARNIGPGCLASK
jgi:hypothetical protein